MPFDASLSDEALIFLKKLDNNLAGRILEKIEMALENPEHYFERLTGREEFKLRVGDYRIIAKIDRKEKKVFVVSIGHRKNVYK